MNGGDNDYSPVLDSFFCDEMVQILWNFLIAQRLRADNVLKLIRRHKSEPVFHNVVVYLSQKVECARGKNEEHFSCVSVVSVPKCPLFNDSRKDVCETSTVFLL